jgi:beta-N-acetylhexosaminidase
LDTARQIIYNDHSQATRPCDRRQCTMERRLNQVLSRRTKALCAATIAALLCLTLTPTGAAAAQPVLAHAQADPIAALMARMTAEEKVGQLFLVAFWGRNPSPPSRAGQLIQQYKVGGAVLLARNNNLVNGAPTTLSDVARLTNLLQGMALDDDGPGLPLLIAVEHEGNGFPHTQITNGTTPLPSPMAIGATWDTRYAEQAGQIAGRELAALGVNLLLGPSVDVLYDPRPGGKGDLGTRAFGGDPYWVGEMGRAYIRGVHTGSQNKVLTVAKHFPGHGGSDRLPDDEVATVDKSLQELERVELAPFFAVTDPRDPEGLDRTDALMSTHIRYRGFRGDIRQFTRPISFDAEALQAILDLPRLRPWRESGVLVSDSLGVLAVRKYFDPQLATFPHRQIAREALLAGNDVLMLSQFALVADWEQEYDNTAEVIEYFNDTYRRDPAFAARVDEAVARILRLKLKLYPDLASGLSPDRVLVAPEGKVDGGRDPEAAESGMATADEIARRATTVLLPSESSLPRPPRRDEEILILAEERQVDECSDPIPECDPRPLLPPRAVEETLLRLYGPEGTGLVTPEHVRTRTYAQLKRFLTSAGGQEEEMRALLQGADWIVFAMLDPDPQYPDSDALQLFLAQNAQLIYDARVVVLAYTAPYYLDATEISKLTAYSVFYSVAQPSIEASVRTLFGEVRPQGRSPVSVEGTYYDLNLQLSPDPAQEIALEWAQPAAPQGEVPLLVRVRTGPILDRNGNPVPDGTLVRFVARDGESGQILDTATGLTATGVLTGGVPTGDVPTDAAVAEAELSIDRPGQVVIVASSGDAGEGQPLTFVARARPTPTPPPPTPTGEPRPTATIAPTASPGPTATPTTQPTATVAPTPTPPPRRSAPVAALDAWAGRPADLLQALGGVALAAIGGLGVSYRRLRRRERAERRSGIVRTILAAWLGGVLATLAYGFWGGAVGQWPGWPGWGVAGAVGFVGAMVGVVVLGRLKNTTAN